MRRLDPIKPLTNWCKLNPDCLKLHVQVNSPVEESERTSYSSAADLKQLLGPQLKQPSQQQQPTVVTCHKQANWMPSIPVEPVGNDAMAFFYSVKSKFVLPDPDIRNDVSVRCF